MIPGSDRDSSCSEDLTLLVSGVVIVGLGFGGAFPTLVSWQLKKKGVSFAGMVACHLPTISDLGESFFNHHLQQLFFGEPVSRLRDVSSGLQLGRELWLL